MSKLEQQREQPESRRGKWRRLPDGAQVRRLATGTIFALLLGMVCAQHWLASLPAPWGGPNVILAGAAILAAAVYAAAELLRIAPRYPNLGIQGMAGRLRDALGLTPAALGALAVSALMTAWALAVHLRNDNFAPDEWGRLSLGGGVLLAVCIAVNRPRRAGLLLLSIVLAVWVSAVFALAMAAFPDPLAYWWVILTDPFERSIGVVVTGGRVAGLAVETAIFSQQLAVAILLTLAALVGGMATLAPSRFAGARQERWRRLLEIALVAALATLVIALAINASRAAEYGTAIGVIIGLPLLWTVRRWRRRILWSLGLLGLCLLAAFNPVFDAGDWAARIKAASDGSADRPPPADYEMPQSEVANRGGTIFANLKAGAPCNNAAITPASSAATPLCYRIGGLTNRRNYVVQLRARYQAGYGSEIGTVRAHPNPERIDITVSWHQPAAPELAGYEFRLRPEGAAGFTPWRPLTIGGATGRGMTINAGRAKMAALRTALDLSEFDDRRTVSSLYAFGGWSLHSRLYQNLMALRYSMDYPLGAGRYAPDRSHLGRELNARDTAILLNARIHNQFLRTLALYGYPGLLLLGALYALAVWSLARAATTALRRGNERLLLLTTAAGMALAAYLSISTLNEPGPFSGDWSHFLLLGLAFCAERMATSGQSKTEENQS